MHSLQGNTLKDRIAEFVEEKKRNWKLAFTYQFISWLCNIYVLHIVCWSRVLRKLQFVFMDFVFSLASWYWSDLCCAIFLALLFFCSGILWTPVTSYFAWQMWLSSQCLLRRHRHAHNRCSIVSWSVVLMSNPFSFQQSKARRKHSQGYQKCNHHENKTILCQKYLITTYVSNYHLIALHCPPTLIRATPNIEIKKVKSSHHPAPKTFYGDSLYHVCVCLGTRVILSAALPQMH